METELKEAARDRSLLRRLSLTWWTRISMFGKKNRSRLLRLHAQGLVEKAPTFSPAYQPHAKQWATRIRGQGYPQYRLSAQGAAFLAASRTKKRQR